MKNSLPATVVSSFVDRMREILLNVGIPHRSKPIVAKPLPGDQRAFPCIESSWRGHLLYMLNQIESGEMVQGATLRWIAFVQGALWQRGLLTFDESCDVWLELLSSDVPVFEEQQQPFILPGLLAASADLSSYLPHEFDGPLVPSVDVIEASSKLFSQEQDAIENLLRCVKPLLEQDERMEYWVHHDPSVFEPGTRVHVDVAFVDPEGKPRVIASLMKTVVKTGELAWNITYTPVFSYPPP